MKITVDRIESRFAVVETENGEILDVDLRLLPYDIQEGDIVELTINKRKKEERVDIIKGLMGDLWEDWYNEKGIEHILNYV